MAADDHSLGLLYFAKVKTKRLLCFDVVGIVQMVPPWRRGKALLFPLGIVIGVWRRSHDEVPEEFEDERWLGADWLFDVSVEDISTWRSGPDEDDVEEEATEELLSSQGRAVESEITDSDPES